MSGLTAPAATASKDPGVASRSAKNCPSPAWPGYASRKDPRRILVIGDSLTLMARSQITSRLTKNGWLVSMRCSIGKGTYWGVQQVNSASRSKKLPNTVVIALGTNDIWWRGDGRMGKAIDQMMKAIGPKRKVYWVNLWFGSSAKRKLPSPRPTNRLLKAKAKQYPNLQIVDFATAFRSAQERDSAVGFWSDGFHFNTAGGRAFARAIAQRVGKPQIPVVAPPEAPEVVPPLE